MRVTKEAGRVFRVFYRFWSTEVFESIVGEVTVGMGIQPYFLCNHNNIHQNTKLQTKLKIIGSWIFCF